MACARRRFKPVLQPSGSRLCGQACVAMLAGLTLDAACTLVGHRHDTHAFELAEALRAAGLYTDGKLKAACRSPWPRLAIMRLQEPGSCRSHWVVWRNGCVHDPAGDITPWLIKSLMTVTTRPVKGVTGGVEMLHG